VISVITWDAGFRESFHTVDCFSQQNFPKEQFEFIWVEYYSKVNSELREKVENMENGRILCFDGAGGWHLGRALNYAVSKCRGDLLVIPDGDIVVDKNFLEIVQKSHAQYKDLALYFRRWDEPQPVCSEKERNSDLSCLEKHCRLNNPTNYGGCLAILRSCIELVGGYEEHYIFAGAGAIGMELYTRLKNAGFPVMWHPVVRIYHPWHGGSAPNSSEYRNKVNKQIWLLKQRDLCIDWRSSTETVEKLLLNYPVKGNAGEENASLEKNSILTRVLNLFR